MKNFVYQGPEKRADKALSEHLGVSRNIIEHLFNLKLITINGVTTKKSVSLITGSEVIVYDDIVEHQDEFVMTHSQSIDLEVLYKTPDYQVIIKPRGVLSHPTSIWELSQPSVVGFIAQQKIQVPSFGGAIRAGIVHRLDRDTEGLMIIATSQRGLSYFGNLFQEKSSGRDTTLIKEYTALCKPNHRGVGLIYQTILPYEYESVIQPKTPHSISKIGKSIIQSFQKNKAFCITVIQIITGRTHQIRIQLSQLGLPIVGDGLYGCNGDYLHLTASKLEFVDPDGIEQKFSYRESWN